MTSGGLRLSGYFAAYFVTVNGSVSLFYSLSETMPNGDGTPMGIRLARAMGCQSP